MIIFPLLWILLVARTELSPRSPDSYDLWLREPEDLEIVE